MGNPVIENGIYPTNPYANRQLYWAVLASLSLSLLPHAGRPTQQPHSAQQKTSFLTRERKWNYLHSGKYKWRAKIFKIRNIECSPVAWMVREWMVDKMRLIQLVVSKNKTSYWFCTRTIRSSSWSMAASMIFMLKPIFYVNVTISWQN